MHVCRHRLLGNRFAWLAFVLAVLAGPEARMANASTLSQAQSIPMPAVVSSFESLRQETGVLIRWKTASEIGVLNFHLYRSDQGAWIKVNSEMVLAANSPAGSTYELLDRNASANQIASYKLTGFDQQNTEHALGIFSVVPKEPEIVPPTGKVSKGSPATLLSGSTPSVANLAVTELTGNTFVKITTTNTGLQFLTADRLATLLGEPLTNVQTAISQRQFQLANRGAAVNYLEASDGSALFFFAEAYKDNYTHKNVFWLTSGTSTPLATIDGQAPPANTNTNFYPSLLNQERDLLTVTTLPFTAEDDFWMWSRLVGGLTFFDTVIYPLTLDRVISNTNVPAELSFQFWGGNAVAHRVQVKVNSTIVTNADWEGLAPLNLDLSVPSSLLVEGSNSITLKALTNGPPNPRSQWYLNKFSLTYPRQFYAKAGAVEFTPGTNNVVTLNGFTNSALKVLDVSNPMSPKLVTNLNVEQVSTNYRATFVPTVPEARYVAFQPGAGTPVDSVSIGQTTNLSHPTNAANYVLITPDSLLTAATNLASYRQQRGLQTIVARLEPIYNEFASGFVTPHAIRAFLATAFTNWSVAPRYAVLIGDGTYDYRNLLGNGDNLTPPLMVSTLYGLFATDSAFGDVDGNGLPEIAVGRLSGNNSSEVTQVINKIKAYELQSIPSPPKSLLVADTPDDAGDFNANMQVIDGILSNKFVNTILRRTDQPDANSMTAALTNSWNQGMDLVNYAGHGAVDRWGNSGYLTSANSTNLNSTRIPVAVAITCVAGQFSVPGTDCLGEFLVRKNSGGAIAVVAPTGLSWNTESMELNVRLTTLLKENTLDAIGDIFRRAMTDHIQEDQPAMVTWIYNLIGDPASSYNVARSVLPPIATTQAATNISTNGAILTGSVTPNGPSAVYFEYGLTESYGSFSTTNLVSNYVPLSVSDAITGLAPGATYHFRVVVENSAGTNQSAELTFTTLPAPPATETQSAVDLTSHTAALRASVNPNGAAASVYFEYGPTTAYGSFSPTNNLPAPNFSHSITQPIANLPASTLFHFRVIAVNNLGTTAGADFTFTTMEGVSPTVTIVSPISSQRVTNNFNFTAAGTAKDTGVGVAEIWYRLNDGPFNLADGTTNWSAPLLLAAGTNILEVKAIDFAANESALVSKTFFAVVFSSLTLATNGDGTIISKASALGTPTNSALLEVGRPYTITAVPGAHKVFTNWTGSAISTNAAFTFTMQSNMNLTASFIPNPFIPVQGIYNGLFHEPASVTHHSAGFFTMKLKTNFAFSGKLSLDGDSISASGKFNLDGTFTKILSRQSIGKPDLTLTLALDFALGADQVTGTVSQASAWTASLSADRVTFGPTNNATAYATNYTLLLPGFFNPADGPPGYSYATLNIHTNGVLRSGGGFADGQMLRQAVPISKNGEWPLYMRLYRSVRVYTNLLKTVNPEVPFLVTNKSYYRGSALAWLNFSPTPTGEISWTKTGWTNLVYPQGFTNQTAVLSSLYTPPVTGVPALVTTNGNVALTDGNLSWALERDFVLTTNNTIFVTPTNQFVRLAIAKKTGLLGGTFRHLDNSNAVTRAYGALLQQQNLGGGYFLGTNQGGKLLLQGE